MNKAQKRQENIIDILSRTHTSSSAILAEKLGVSTETIRKDVKKLSKENKIIKTHGAIMLQDNPKNYYPFDLRRKMNSANKSKIGIKASELVEEGDVILLENSTTSLALVEALLTNRKLFETLTLITNSFSIVALIEKEGLLKGCFFLGGWVDFSQHSTTGATMQEMFLNLYIDKAFLSAAAVNREGVLSSYYENDRIFQKLALKQSKQTILMVAQDKYPKQALMRVAQISDFSKIVTNAVFSAETMEELNKSGGTNDNLIIRV